MRYSGGIYSGDYLLKNCCSTPADLDFEPVGHSYSDIADVGYRYSCHHIQDCYDSKSLDFGIGTVEQEDKRTELHFPRNADGGDSSHHDTKKYRQYGRVHPLYRLKPQKEDW